MAQLVARLVRNEKVRGSNPLSSTHPNPGLLLEVRGFCMRTCAFYCCNMHQRYVEAVESLVTTGTITIEELKQLFLRLS